MILQTKASLNLSWEKKMLWAKTGSVGNLWFDKISLQSQVKFRGFCDISKECLSAFELETQSRIQQLQT